MALAILGVRLVRISDTNKKPALAMLLMLGFVPRSMTHLFICLGIVVLLFGMIALWQFKGKHGQKE